MIQNVGCKNKQTHMNNNQYTNKHDRNSLLKFARTLAEIEIQSVHDLRAAYVAFVATSKVWQDDEYALRLRFAVALQLLPKGRCTRVLQTSPHSLRLVSYQSGKTLLLIRVSYRSHFGPASLNREGKELTYVLIERLFVCVFHGGELALQY